MALPIHIPDLFTGTVVEWERLEFKAGWNPEAALRALCAFANDLHNWGGGYFVIGVAEADGRPVLPPVGLSRGELDTIQKDIVRIANRIVPAYHPVVEPATFQGKPIVVVWAPGGQTRPYKAPVSLANGEKEYAYYVRVGSSTVRAKGPLEAELIQLAASVPFDDRSRHDAEISDLSLRLIQAHLQDVKSALFDTAGQMDFVSLCRQMQIVDGPPENPRPRNVGLLFFSDVPQRYFPQATIDVVHFPHGRAEAFREQRFAGPVARQLRDALSFIQASFISEHVVKHPRRAEADRFYTFPYRAVEEALANAVFHRGYDVAEPIEVQVTPTEMTITSYPGPDASVRMAALNQGGVVARRYRNRRVGEFLKELHLTEGRGTGVPTIFKAMRENGSDEPQFDTDEARTYFTTTLPAHPLTRANSTAPSAPAARAADWLSDERMVRVLKLSVTPATRAALQSALGFADATHFRRTLLKPLLDAGLLALTVPGSPRSPEQRYQTTQTGRFLLERGEEA